jgi:DNA-binding Lrp family transcriptional regulator
MELKDVLAQVPGLEKRFVYYLESLGYIQPTRVPKRRIARRDYAPADLQRIQDLWRYYQRGYALQAAQDLVARPRHRAYVLLQVPWPRRDAAWQDLLALPGLREACLLYGAPADALICLEVAAESEVYEALSRLISHGLVASAPTVLHLARWVEGTRPGARAEGARQMQAYVLIKLPAKHVEEALRELQSIAAIVEAGVIYGETDIIAKVVVSDQAALDDLVFRRLHAMPTVESTRTFIVVGDLHWEREDGATGRDAARDAATATRTREE